MWYRRISIAFGVLVIACISAAASSFATDFPHRKDFPNVSYISSQDLKALYDNNNVIIIDVRSKIEYDAIHIDKALHIPMAYATFVDDVEKSAKKTPKKKIVFYCNGITCLKSYESAQKMDESGHKNSIAYDAGIPEWSKLYPKDTIVMGRVLTNPEKQLISDDEFNKRLVDFETFRARAASGNALVIDVRDYIQKSGSLPGLEKAKAIPLDTFIPNFVAKKEEQGKTLLIFDQVGKQIKWLMYYLRENGYEHYFFLNKGATEVLKKQEYK